MVSYSAAYDVHGPAKAVLSKMFNEHIRYPSVRIESDLKISKFAGYCNECKGILMTADNGICNACGFKNVVNTTQTGDIVPKENEEMTKEEAVTKLADLSSPKNLRLKWALTINKESGNVIAFTRGSGCVTLDPTIEMYPSWAVFEESVSIDQIKAMVKRYNVDVPKKINKMDCTLLVWDAMCSVASIDPGVKVDKPANTEVKKKLSDRGYQMIVMMSQDGIDRDNASIKLAPQAKACLKIMQDMKMDLIPEALLKEKIIENASSLNTRQDPWRIFQYYRAQLITLNWFRLV